MLWGERRGVGSGEGLPRRRCRLGVPLSRAPVFLQRASAGGGLGEKKENQRRAAAADGMGTGRKALDASFWAWPIRSIWARIALYGLSLWFGLSAALVSDSSHPLLGQTEIC